MRESGPYSVHVVDKRGMRRFVCRRPSIVDCAEVADQLLNGAPGMLVEVLEERPGGAYPVSVTAGPPVQ